MTHLDQKTSKLRRGILVALLLVAPAALAAASAAAAPRDATPAARSAAPAEACERDFVAAGGTFDPAKTVAACRRAADAGDPRAMQRLGLLSLAGLGTGKDLDAAAQLCRAAQARDPAVSAGFCLAAVAAERRRHAAGAAAPPAAAEAPTPSMAGRIAQWRERANLGDRDAPARLCETYFGVSGVAFDAVNAARWCRTAAEYGDAHAMQRLGTMRLWGVGVERDVPQAEALCRGAEARDATLSAAYCLAAVHQERELAASISEPQHFSYPAPWQVSPDLGEHPNALAADRILESRHTTAGGLDYSCRDLIRWSRYEASHGLDVVTSAMQPFGRSILKYRAEDYTALDRGAEACAVAISPYDEDASERRQLAEFRKLLPVLEQHQRQLAKQTHELEADNLRRTREEQQRANRFFVSVAMLSKPQQECIASIRRGWLARQLSPETRSIEVRTAESHVAGGDTVVSGTARISDSDDRTSNTVYSCTFAGQSLTITDKTMLPAAASALRGSLGQ